MNVMFQKKINVMVQKKMDECDVMFQKEMNVMVQKKMNELDGSKKRWLPGGSVQRPGASISRNIFYGQFSCLLLFLSNQSVL